MLHQNLLLLSTSDFEPLMGGLNVNKNKGKEVTSPDCIVVSNNRISSLASCHSRNVKLSTP